MTTREAPKTLAAINSWARAFGSVGLGFGSALAVRGWSERSARSIARAACARVLRDFGIDLRVEDRSGLPPNDERPVLFVHLDQQTLLSVAVYPLVLPRPTALIVNAEFALLPLVGWYVVADGAVVIVRQWPSQARSAVHRAAEQLRRGKPFGMSIEGQRSRDGSLSPYKKGAAVLAIEAQCEIVPFMTHGEWELWPRGEWRVRPGTIDAVVYPAIPTRGMRYDDRDELVARLRELAVSERHARSR